MKSPFTKLRGIFPRKGRRYPIKKTNVYGLNFTSARQICFFSFDMGMSPAWAARISGVSPRTARRYKHDWRKLPEKFRAQHKLAKAAHKKIVGFKQQTIEYLARELRMTEDQVLERLERPWAIHQLLRGKWAEVEEAEEAIETEVEARLRNVLQILCLFEMGMPLRKITEALRRISDEYEREQKNKQEVITPSPPRSGLEEEDGRRTEA